MWTVIVSSEEEAKTEVAKLASEGLRLAAASNAGLPAPQVRLTFLPKEVFKDDSR